MGYPHSFVRNFHKIMLEIRILTSVWKRVKQNLPEWRNTMESQTLKKITASLEKKKYMGLGMYFPS